MAEIMKAVLYIKKNIEDNSNRTLVNEMKSRMEDNDMGETDMDKEMKSKGYYKLQVQYNPASLSLSNSSETEEDEQAAGTKDGSVGRVSLNSRSVLSFELIFESTGLSYDKDYVKKNAEGIMALMLDNELNDVVFCYGGMSFKGEFNNVDINYTMFDHGGNPIWAVVSVSILEKKEDTQNEKSSASMSEYQGTAQYSYDSMVTEYEEFRNPVVVVKINQTDISENKSGLSVSEVEVELTSGFEASIAIFSIYNSFDKDRAAFRTDEIKKYIYLGSSVSISMGYSEISKIIFRGFIAKTNFIYEQGEIPHVQVTCMDAKGIMMSGSYAKQLVSGSYGDAVQEIFNKSVYTSMQDKEILTGLSIGQTPDAKESSEGENDCTIEMVNESDYEFVVRAAKKFNYEFFIDCGVAVFRKAKSDSEVKIILKLGETLKKFDIEYDITGLVESIYVRGMDTGKMKLIQAKSTMNNKISMGNKAKQLIKKSEKVFIDSTIKSQQDADYRGEYLLEDMSYRFGTLCCECIGIPELKPGSFVQVSGMGEPADNKFYVTSVRHVINAEGIYTSNITAKASSL